MPSRFQFTLRDLLYAVLVLSIVLASPWRVRVERERYLSLERQYHLSDQKHRADTAERFERRFIEMRDERDRLKVENHALRTGQPTSP